MLTTLRIKNLALVADLTLELRPGYNAITGETGAGKSILIGALSLVLGERADRTLIRTGSEACSVEAIFDVSQLRAPLAQFLDENGLEPCESAQLVLRRSFTVNGTNRQFINGSPTTLQVLNTLGQWLVDIHGPHEHQSLLHPSHQLDILDAFGNLRPLRNQFSEALQEVRKLEQEKLALIVDERTFAQQLDLLRFQANEIKAAKLEPDEEAGLEEEFQRAHNSARLLRLSQTVLGLVAEEENSLIPQAGMLGRTLQEMEKTDLAARPLLVLQQGVIENLHELQRQTAAYADRLEIDPLRYQQLEDRLNLIQGLKRKYGSTLSDVLRFGQEAREKLNRLEQHDLELARIDAELATRNAKLRDLGEELSAQRRKVIPKLAKAAIKQLVDLGFRQAHFDIALQSGVPSAPVSDTLTASGFDKIEFQFAPNEGEAPRPLRAIASSGELARVMLALKTVLAAEDEIPVLIFDEVDANVGGQTAHAVGQKMHQIATQRQVLCITHLAPVAASAGAHYVVTKVTSAGRTTSKIELLDRPGRIAELARMLGGQSQAAIQHAEELLSNRS